MLRLKKEQLGLIKELSSVFVDTTCYTVMQGIGGSAWVDSVDSPNVVATVYGDFCFLAGEADKEKGEQELFQLLKDCAKTWAIFVPETQSWLEVLEQSERFEGFDRYRFKKRTEPFDKNLLLEYEAKLPDEFHIERITEKWYDKLGDEEWSSDLCRQIPTVEEYVEHGLGFLVVKGETPVAGVSSYSYYDKGIEIEIDTKKEYRRRGLATVLGARIILQCMESGLYPNWDAANLISVQTAKKLGYEFDRTYRAFSNIELGER